MLRNNENVVNKLKIVIRIVLFCILGIVINYVLSMIFVPKTVSKEKGLYRAIISGFYSEPRNSLDVVFIGDSGIYKGISPMKIWEDYGIASYDFASPTQKIWDSYYCINEVFKYQKPKVIVVNAEQFFSEKPMKNVYKSHLYDNMKMGQNKIEAIISKVQKNSKKSIFSYMFPLFRFHSRWNELDEDDFKYSFMDFSYTLKGYIVTKNVNPYSKGEYMKKKNQEDKIGPKVNEYLEKIKHICRQNNVQLLIVEIPSPNSWNATKYEEVKKWSENNSIKYIDFNRKTEELEINWEKDTEDAGIHMNKYGAEKLSIYIGQYLKDNYQLVNRREQKEYMKWEKDLEEYKKIVSK